MMEVKRHNIIFSQSWPLKYQVKVGLRYCFIQELHVHNATVVLLLVDFNFMNTCTQTRTRFGPEKRAGKQNQIVTKNRIIKNFLLLGLLSVLSYSQPNPKHCVEKSSIHYQIMLDFQFIEVVPA